VITVSVLVYALSIVMFRHYTGFCSKS